MTLRNGYEPGFDIQLDYGHVGEQLVDWGLGYIASGKGEVKRDRKAMATGNVYVEYAACGLDGRWKPSGLAATKSTLYSFVFADTGVFIVFPTEVLKYIARQVGRNPRRLAEQTYDKCPTKGVLVTLGDLVRLSGELPFVPPPWSVPDAPF